MSNYEQYTEEEQEQFREWAVEYLPYFRFHKFCPNYLKIKTKKGDIINFKLNHHQKKFLMVYYQQLKEGRPIRIIVLKDRQKGISTLVEAILFHRTAFRDERKAGVISYKKQSTDAIFKMFLRYNKYFPEALQYANLMSRNAKGLFYDNGSEINLYTAESGDVGSGETIQDLHVTELSKYRDPETTLVAVLQTVPDAENSMVVIESTAAGAGDEFHKRWKMAERGESTYQPVFLSWLEDNEYTIKFRSEDDREVFMNTIDAEEQRLVKLGATPEHLHWRRKIGLPDKCGGNIYKFHQEYPATPNEAFIASGNPVFDSQTCYIKTEEAIDYKKFPNVRGEFEYIKNELGEIIGVKWVQNASGRWFKYRPIDNNSTMESRYCGGADVAEGKGEEDDHDYTSFAMLDREKMDVPIEFWDRDTDEDQFAEELYKLYLYMNKNLWINVLRLAGHVVITRLFKLSVKLYFAEDYTKGWREDKKIIGYDERGNGKKRGIDDLREYIRTSSFCDYSKIFWDEATTYVNKKGIMEAQSGCHDDTVAARMAMIVCHKWLPSPRLMVAEVESERYYEAYDAGITTF